MARRSDSYDQQQLAYERAQQLAYDQRLAARQVQANCTHPNANSMGWGGDANGRFELMSCSDCGACWNEYK